MSELANKTGAWRERWAINWRNAGFFFAIHAVAILALIPWFFSWTGVLVCVAGSYIIGMMGVNVGYHRLFTHRSFSCPLWVERTLAILGCCCGQDSPTYWVAVHRCHHRHADDELDPHSPRHGFFWSHVGWLVLQRHDLNRGPLMDQYAKDLRRDPFQAWLVKHDNWIFIMIASWILLFIAGFCGAAWYGSSSATAAQFGLSLLIWGGALRTVLLWHFTWSVNSVTHVWGYRNYATPDRSRNNPIIALIAGGEGWHNNHHADPVSARHGHKWWEFDPAWVAISLMLALGLAKNARLPAPSLATRFNGQGVRPALEDFVPPETDSPTLLRL